MKSERFGQEKVTRRDFLKKTLAAAEVILTGGLVAVSVELLRRRKANELTWNEFAKPFVNTNSSNNKP